MRRFLNSDVLVLVLFQLSLSLTRADGEDEPSTPDVFLLCPQQQSCILKICEESRSCCLSDNSLSALNVFTTFQ
jgi:hypothetical protein